MAALLLESLSRQRERLSGGRESDVADGHTRVCGPLDLEREETGDERLAVSRTDIEFFNVGEDEVAIEIQVTNESSQASRPTVAMVSAAAFGAFVPWQPLATVSIPRLLPGQTRVLRTRGIPVRPEP